MTRISSSADDLARAAACSHPRVAVVLATLGLRPDLTRRTLEALSNQHCDNVELIVVLNGEGGAGFEEMLGAFRLRLIKVPWRGQSRAQNVGVRASDATLLAFTDDDVVPHPEWLHSLVAGFSAPDVGCVTGRAELIGPSYLRRGLVYSQRSLSRWTISPHDRDWVNVALQSDAGMAANHAFRRDVLFRFGLIPEDLSGGAAIDTIESELYLKVLYAGYKLHHTPDAVVDLHFEDPPDLQKARLAGMRAAMVALYLKLLLEDRGLPGLKWRIFQGLLSAIRRTLARVPEPGVDRVQLSRLEGWSAYLHGFVLYWRSRQDTSAARARAEQEELSSHDPGRPYAGEAKGSSGG